MADAHKNGNVVQVSEAETEEIALRTYEKESKFASILALISVVGIITLITVAYYLGVNFDDAIFYLFVFLFLVCLFMLGFSIFMAANLREQYRSNDEREPFESEGRSGPIENNKGASSEILVTKITPASGLNVKRRLVGFLFGASIPLLFIVEFVDYSTLGTLERATWKYMSIVVVGFGVVGFILGDKYYDKLRKLFKSLIRSI